MQCHDEDKLIPVDEIHVGEFWDLDKTQLEGLYMRERILQPSSPKSWSPPPPMVFKLNFDGASRGNPGLMGFGGLCRDSLGRIIFVFWGPLVVIPITRLSLRGCFKACNVWCATIVSR